MLGKIKTENITGEPINGKPLAVCLLWFRRKYYYSESIKLCNTYSVHLNWAKNQVMFPSNFASINVDHWSTEAVGYLQKQVWGGGAGGWINYSRQVEGSSLSPD